MINQDENVFIGTVEGEPEETSCENVIKAVKDAVDAALEHFDAIKPSVMLQIAQKTVKSMFDKEVTSDDLGLDLEYLMNSEIFGTGYDESDEDEEDSSLLDELNDEDDDIDPEDEEDLVD